MCEDKLREIGKTQKIKANQCLRVLSAVFSFAQAYYETADGEPIFKNNPVKRTGQLGLWNRTNVKELAIYEHQYPALFGILSTLSRRTRSFQDSLLFRLTADFCHVVDVRQC